MIFFVTSGPVLQPAISSPAWSGVFKRLTHKAFLNMSPSFRILVSGIIYWSNFSLPFLIHNAKEAKPGEFHHLSFSKAKSVPVNLETLRPLIYQNLLIFYTRYPSICHSMNNLALHLTFCTPDLLSKGLYLLVFHCV